jgi:hypothetical protein
MNERTKELIQKMGWEEQGADLWGKTHDGCLTVYALERLTALIVKKCASIASNTNLEDVEGGDSSVLAAAAQQIKNHFGVNHD